MAGDAVRSEAARRAEDLAGNSLHLLLIAAAMVGAWRGGGDRRLRAFAGCLLVAFLFFCVVLRWQPWHSRLHLPLFILGAPMVGVVFERLRPALLAIGLLLLAGSSAYFLTGNKAHHLVGRRSVFIRTWAEQRRGMPARPTSARRASSCPRDVPTWAWPSATTIANISSGALWRMPAGAAASSQCSSPMHLRPRPAGGSRVGFRPCAIVRQYPGAPAAGLTLGAQSYRTTWSRDDIQVLVPDSPGRQNDGCSRLACPWRGGPGPCPPSKCWMVTGAPISSKSRRDAGPRRFCRARLAEDRVGSNIAHGRTSSRPARRLWRNDVSHRLIAVLSAVLAILAAGCGRVPAAGPASAISAPRPISTTPYHVGAYYFPGWPTLDKWKVLDAFPERTPLLGYYREGDPSVMDWQIKWAVEHGISFFAFDWYWDRGRRQLRARPARRLLPRALPAVHGEVLPPLGEPQPAPGRRRRRDLLAMTDYWIANYFRQADYLTIDGKPVVIVFHGNPRGTAAGHGHRRGPHGLRPDARAGAGGGATGDLHHGGGAGDAARALVHEGYDAGTGYNYPRAGMPDDTALSAPYSAMVDGYEQKIWYSIAVASGLIGDYAPVTEPGWDFGPGPGGTRRWSGRGGTPRSSRTC